MRDGSSDDSASFAKPPSRWGNIFVGLLLGGVIGAGALYVTKVDPSLISGVTGSAASVAPSAAATTTDEEGAPVPHQGLPRTPFEMGALPAGEAVDSIKITLGVGTEGAGLSGWRERSR